MFWLVILLYALFASIFTISKQSLFCAEPYFLVGTRMAIAGILMLGFQALRCRKELIIKKGTILRLCSLAFFNIYITNTSEFWGLKHLTSFKTCFIYSLSPFVAALLSFLFFKEKLHYKKWIGLAVGFCGLLPVLLSHTSLEEAAGSLWVFSRAELAVVVAAISGVYGWMVLKQLVQENGYSPITANGYSMLFGGVLALSHSLIVEEWTPIPVTDVWPFVGCTFFLIAISNCICYNLYGHLLKTFSATFMSFAGLTTPLFTVFFGYLVHGEVTNMSFWVSFSIVASGLLLFYLEELKKKAIQI